MEDRLSLSIYCWFSSLHRQETKPLLWIAIFEQIFLSLKHYKALYITSQGNREFLKKSSTSGNKKDNFGRRCDILKWPPFFGTSNQVCRAVVPVGVGKDKEKEVTCRRGWGRNYAVTLFALFCFDFCFSMSLIISLGKSTQRSDHSSRFIFIPL